MIFYSRSEGPSLLIPAPPFRYFSLVPQELRRAGPCAGNWLPELPRNLEDARRLGCAHAHRRRPCCGAGGPCNPTAHARHGTPLRVSYVACFTLAMVAILLLSYCSVQLMPCARAQFFLLSRLHTRMNEKHHAFSWWVGGVGRVRFPVSRGGRLRKSAMLVYENWSLADPNGTREYGVIVGVGWGR